MAILPVLTCFALLPGARALNPAPDGCYPNFTTAEGCNALSLLTTGAGNTGLGWCSLFLDTTGSFNTAVGAGALALNNGRFQYAVGAVALLLNTTGTQNTAVGPMRWSLTTAVRQHCHWLLCAHEQYDRRLQHRHGGEALTANTRKQQHSHR